MSGSLRFDSMRPLVRYVDEDQAVIDTHFSTHASFPDAPDPDEVVEVLVRVEGDDGFEDEGRTPMRLTDGTGSVRFEIVHPQRWWPASLGEQPLYHLTVGLAHHDELADHRTVTLGLTSVRADAGAPPDHPSLVVNGSPLNVESWVMVDRVSEQKLLPVTGASIMLVRDHYGPEVLYEAADRAGILLIQCVPVSADTAPEDELRAQVNRLSPHPSLAGWYVGHLGDLAERVSHRIHGLDPTRLVWQELPIADAA